MVKKIKFVSTLLSSEVKETKFHHTQYMQCKTAHGHFISLIDNDPIRVILTAYIRQFGIKVPTKFDEIVNKICLLRIPLNMEYTVRRSEMSEFGDVRINPVDE